MLVARLKNGALIELTKRWTKKELVTLKNTETFFCPCCRGEVILKLGTKKQWHFAHVRENALCQTFEKESDIHLLGKKQLYLWLKKTKQTVYLEKFFPQCKQRPDIYYEHRKRKVAVEFQCSPISYELHYKRTLSYLNDGIYPLWIIGAHHLRRISSHLFLLHTFEWSSTFPLPHYPHPYLLYYCPETMTFILLKDIISLSKTKIIACAVTEKMDSLTSFHELFLKQAPHYCQKDWLDIKRRWRLKTCAYPSKALRFFQQYSYERKMSPGFFPAVCGWYVKDAFYIETPPYIWQSWIVYEFLLDKKAGDIVSFGEIYRSFQRLVDANIFHIRSLPLHDGHYSIAIKNYLRLLSHFCILEIKSRDVFLIKRKVETIMTIDEALSLDEYYSKMVEKEVFAVGGVGFGNQIKKTRRSAKRENVEFRGYFCDR